MKSFDPQGRSASDFSYIADTTHTAFSALDLPDAQVLANKIFSVKPLYKNWDKLGDEIERIVLEKRQEEFMKGNKKGKKK